MSLETALWKGTSLVPDPRDCDVVLAYPDDDVPYSNQAVVAEPFGLAVPWRRALVLATALALPVVTEGG
ncbi:MAG: hypothetical protein NVS3B1_08750 [Marmoricola sp.]